MQDSRAISISQILVRSHNNLASSSNASKPWVIDSGAIHHLTNDMENLAIHSKYTRLEKIVISDGKTLLISHIGLNTFSLNSKSYIFQDILHVSSASHNLLSVNSFTRTNNVSFEFFFLTIF